MSQKNKKHNKKHTKKHNKKSHINKNNINILKIKL